MKRRHMHRVLFLAAVGSLAMSQRGAEAQSVSTWTGAESSSFSNVSNWATGTVPGPTDVGLFSNVPNGNTVTFNQAQTSVGAIRYTNQANGATFTGTSTVTFGGATVTVDQAGTNFTGSNVAVAHTSLSSTVVQTLTFGSNVTLNIPGPRSIVLSPGSGQGNGTTVVINGTVSGSGALQILGGGTASNGGGGVLLGNGSVYRGTGGLTLGSSNNVQSASVSVTATGGLPTTGTITVFDGSQILFSASATGSTSGTYGSTGQTLVLSSVGVAGGAGGASGALRTAQPTNAFNTIAWAGSTVLNPSATGDVYFAPTSAANNAFALLGPISGAAVLRKAGGGTLELFGPSTLTGGTYLGQGAIVARDGSAVGTGPVTFGQTGGNSTVLVLQNAAQTVGPISSLFSTSGAIRTQTLQLSGTASGGTVLTINQSSNSTFGYGTATNQTTSISGPGSIVVAAGSTGIWTLTGSATFSGGTTINGGAINVANGANGSALGTGPVVVNSGGTLLSGNGASTSNGSGIVATTSGQFSGSLTVNPGGVVSPGGNNLVGSLQINGGGLTANNGSVFNFDLIGGITASSDRITLSGGTLTLQPGSTATINVRGSTLATGTYPLISLNGAGYADINNLFVLGSVPSAGTRAYSLVNTASGVNLVITPTATDRIWSVGGAVSLADGAGNWANGTVNFASSGPGGTAGNVAWDNASNQSLVIGAGGAGGTISLTGPVRVGGPLVFNSSTTPYTVGTAGSANSLTLGAGAVATVAATINAPVLLESTQTFSVASGTTLTTTGGIGQTGTASGLVKTDLGTLVLGGPSTFTGGVTIAGGTLQSSTSNLPTVGGVTTNATLAFVQGSNGSYAGLIGGTGGVAVSLTSPTAAVALTGVNSYGGPTTLNSGVLQVASVANLGTGAGGIVLAGGTLQATGALTFPNTDGRVLNLAGALSTIDTNGNNVTVGNRITGTGGLVKRGAGDLTVASTGIVTTSVIGEVQVLGGTLVLQPPAGFPSFGFSGSPTGSLTTFTGDLALAGNMELRLQGGTIAGGGRIFVDGLATNIVSRGTDTVIGNTIVLNRAGTPNFTTNIGANNSAGIVNSLAITAPITGDASVSFTGGAGYVVLSASSTYLGSTRIDNSAGGDVGTTIDNPFPAGTDLSVSSSGLLNLNGRIVTVGSLSATSSRATVQNGGFNPVLTNTSTATLVIGGSGAVAGGASAEYDGVLTDGQQDATIVLPLALTLSGGFTGEQRLTGASNAFSGAVNIVGGALTIADAGALGAPSVINVGATANNSQLVFDGVAGNINWQSLFGGQPASPIVVAGDGGFNTGASQQPGAIRVRGEVGLTLDSNITLAATGGINVTSSSTLTQTGSISGPGGLNKYNTGPLILQGNNSYAGPTTISAGLLVADSALPAGNNVVNAGTLQLNVGGGLGSIRSTNAATGESGTVGLANGVTVTATQIRQLGLTLGDNARLTLPANTLTPAAKGNVLTSLTLGPGAFFDLGNNDLVLRETSAAAARALVSAWFNGGNPASSGLGSSLATFASATTLAVFGNLDVAGTPYFSSYDGITLSAGDTILKYTYLGDTNLDGVVNGTDLGNLIEGLSLGANVPSALAWAYGDFNYNGVVGLDDLSAYYRGLAAFGTGGSLGNGSAERYSLTGAVPEPSAAGVVMAGAAMLTRRRRTAR